MISVRHNPNFRKFFQVFSFGRMIEEINSRTKALKLAKEEARRYSLTHVNYLGELIESNK
jgi:hypothetical protein